MVRASPVGGGTGDSTTSTTNGTDDSTDSTLSQRRFDQRRETVVGQEPDTSDETTDTTDTDTGDDLTREEQRRRETVTTEEPDATEPTETDTLDGGGLQEGQPTGQQIEQAEGDGLDESARLQQADRVGDETIRQVRQFEQAQSAAEQRAFEQRQESLATEDFRDVQEFSQRRSQARAEAFEQRQEEIGQEQFRTVQEFAQRRATQRAEAYQEAESEARQDIEQQLEEQTGAELTQEDVAYRLTDEGQLVGRLTDEGREEVAVQTAPGRDIPVVGGLTTTGARVRQFELRQTDPYAEGFRDVTPGREDVFRPLEESPVTGPAFDFGEDVEAAQTRAGERAAGELAEGVTAADGDTTESEGAQAAEELSLHLGGADANRSDPEPLPSGSDLSATAATLAPVAVAEPTPFGEVAVGGLATAGAVATLFGGGSVAAGVKTGGVETVEARAEIDPDVTSPSELPVPTQPGEAGMPEDIGQPTGRESTFTGEELPTPEGQEPVAPTEQPTPEGDEPVAPPEMGVPDTAPGDTPTDPGTIQTGQQGVVQEGEVGQQQEADEPTISPEDVAEPLPEPDQPGPSTRERQRREDLTPFERGFPTGGRAVVGRETELTEFELQEELGRSSVYDEPSVGTGQAQLPFVGTRPAADQMSDQLVDPLVGIDTVSDADVQQELDVEQDTQLQQQEVQAPEFGGPTGFGYPDEPSFPEQTGYPFQFAPPDTPSTRRPRPDLPEMEEDEAEKKRRGAGVGAALYADFRDPLSGDVLETERDSEGTATIDELFNV